MMRRCVLAIGIVGMVFTGVLFCQDAKKAPQSDALKSAATAPAAKGNQLVLWTSSDREAALKMVLMYTYNCKKRGWMDTVRLMVWGPSAKLLSEDTVLQAELKDLKDAGVELYACKGCADLYHVSDVLAGLGITVMYTGEMLADLQKRGWHVLTI